MKHYEKLLEKGCFSRAAKMVIYDYQKKGSEIWLLYPLNDEMRGHADLSFDSGDGTTVHVFFVDVANIEESLTELKQKLEET